MNPRPYENGTIVGAQIYRALVVAPVFNETETVRLARLPSGRLP